MDNLSMILNMIRQEMERYPDRPPAFVLNEAEGRIRRTMGGLKVHICRMAKADTLRRLEALPADTTPQQAAAILGVDESYVRRLRKLL